MALSTTQVQFRTMLQDPILLLLSDDSAQLHRMRQVLGADRYIVVPAESPARVVELLHSVTPDLIVSELNVAGMTAIDFCRSLKDNPATRDIPYLLLSSSPQSPRYVQDAFDAGIDDYLDLHGPETILQNKAARLIAASQDVRARRVAESKYTSLVATLQGVVCVCDPEPPYGMLFVSPPIAGLGYSEEEWLGNPYRWIESIHPEDRDWVLQETHNAYCRAGANDYQYRFIAANGSVLWLHDTGQFVKGNNGRLKYWQKLIFDITERKLIDSAIDKNKDRLRTFLQHGSELFLILDPNADVLHASPSISRLLGYHSVDITAHSLPDFLHLDDHQSLADRLPGRAGTPSEVTSTELRFKHTDGHFVSFACEIRDLSELPHIGGLLLVGHDITDLKEAEAEMRHSQKLATIGQLTAGIAHDLNNRLTTIAGNCAILNDVLPEDGPAREEVHEIDTAQQLATLLVRQLTAFTRKQVVRPAVLDLNPLTADATKLFGQMVGEDIKITTLLDPALPPIKADVGQLQQIILNLVVNARDAMPHGGTVTITTFSMAVASQAPVPPGDYVVLEVRDTGFGIQPAHLGRIFEPFFTTKEPGKGTGLGLSVTRDLVTENGGYITVTSEPAQGTTFSIYIPECAVIPGDPALSDSILGTGSSTILLVEEDGAVRRLAREMLQRLRYAVLEASSPEEAMLICSNHPASIDLLLTDVVMPDIDGPKLAAALTMQRPEMNVLYMSGHPNHPTLIEEVLKPGKLCLMKPFTPEALAAQVRAALSLRVS